MSPSSCFKLLLLSFYNLLQLSYCSSVHSSHNNNIISSGHTSSSTSSLSTINDWHRNLESQFSRLVGRLDQLELRVGRVQSLVQMRFDNIENGMTTTKLRLDLWGDEFNRIEEGLTRKWKILESKFDLMISNMDNKIESKLTLIQRDNRRHNEILGSSFNAVAQAQERLNEKVQSSMAEMNSSISTLRKEMNRPELLISPSVISVLTQKSDSTLSLLQEFISNSTSQQQQQQTLQPTSNNNSGRTRGHNTQNNNLPGGSSGGIPEPHQNHSFVQYQLLGNKVTNMFEDLIRRSSNVESTLKDSIAMINFTRKDLHDGFRAILASSSSSQQQQQNLYGSSGGGQHHQNSRNSQSRTGNQYGFSSSNHNAGGTGGSSSSSSSGSSSEVISAVIVEAITSVESMSNALGRRMTDFTRSIDQKLEMVSMSINGFLESCIRIQDGAPLIEDHIADMLIKILDTVDNSTKSASELWQTVARQILQQTNETTRECPHGINPSSSITSTETITMQPYDYHRQVHLSSKRRPGGLNDSRLVLPQSNNNPSTAQHEEDGEDDDDNSRLPQPPQPHFLEEDSSSDYTSITTTTSNNGRRRSNHPFQQSSNSTNPSAFRKRPFNNHNSSSTTSSSNSFSSPGIIRPPLLSPTTHTRSPSSSTNPHHHPPPPPPPEEEDLPDGLTEEDKNSLWESYFPQVPE